MLEIRNFEKSYPNGFRLKIDDLSVADGVHLIQGENGSGKSTLFKAIAGIHPFKGEILLDRISIKHSPVSYRSMVNYAPAEPQFPDFLSLDELAGFVAKAKKAAPEQSGFLMDLFGVRNFSTYAVGTYSSGMLKKTALILAFLGNPRLVILDEPFTTIDKETQDNLLSLIGDQRREGVSFLVSSHHLPDEERFRFDAAFRLANGQLV